MGLWEQIYSIKFERVLIGSVPVHKLMCTNNDVHAPALSLSVMTVRVVGCNFAPTATGSLKAQGHRVTDATVSCSPAGMSHLIHRTINTCRYAVELF